MIREPRSRDHRLGSLKNEVVFTRGIDFESMGCPPEAPFPHVLHSLHHLAYSKANAGGLRMG